MIWAMHRPDLPVILVLTQVPTRGGQPHPDAVMLAENIQGCDLPIFGRRAFLYDGAN